ncbi:MAG: hypothetical protein AAFN11_01475 [Chloroflexota bacterium]
MERLITSIQSKDVQSVADTFPLLDYERVNALYIDFLQEKRLTLVAIDKQDTPQDAEIVISAPPPTYLACVSLLWKADYDPFWRRNIPQIDTFVVQHDDAELAIDLLTACEQASKKHGCYALGISLPEDETFIGDLLIEQGYVAKGSGIKVETGILRCVKRI